MKKLSKPMRRLLRAMQDGATVVVVAHTCAWLHQGQSKYGSPVMSPANRRTVEALEQRGLVEGKWGAVTDNRYYTLTEKGKTC